ncbi:hypothetical protein GALMADRAFT_216749 [Galerina marginata CBS 339.88]|uniref:Uncharacterized protein n=1 Tax=Galerina marginata (strain CBS 339.88) TaxID=685588 RepID=A0A067S7N0_GALM3|nr:hypothetical protein GALMADRAFT_216749 [Galerina marginata CBS 339.88]
MSHRITLAEVECPKNLQDAKLPMRRENAALRRKLADISNDNGDDNDNDEEHASRSSKRRRMRNPSPTSPTTPAVAKSKTCSSTPLATSFASSMRFGFFIKGLNSRRAKTASRNRHNCSAVFGILDVDLVDPEQRKAEFRGRIGWVIPSALSTNTASHSPQLIGGDSKEGFRFLHILIRDHRCAVAMKRLTTTSGHCPPPIDSVIVSARTRRVDFKLLLVDRAISR